MEENIKPTLSVIVSFFDAIEHYTRFIDMCPYHSNVEVIFVNDGCSEPYDLDRFHAREDFKYFELHENSGIYLARSFGVKNASGRYLWHVDIDDIIIPSAFNIVLTKIEVYDGAIIEFNNIHKYHIYNKEISRLFLSKLFRYFYSSPPLGSFGYVWNKLIPVELWPFYDLRSLNWHWDTVLNFSFKTNNWVYSSESIILYVTGHNSVTVQSKTVSDRSFRIFKDIIDILGTDELNYTIVIRHIALSTRRSNYDIFIANRISFFSTIMAIDELTIVNRIERRLLFVLPNKLVYLYLRYLRIL